MPEPSEVSSQNSSEVGPGSIADGRPWLTVSETAAYLQCSPQHVRALIHNRELQAAKLGQGFRLLREDLDRLLMRRKKFHGSYRKNTHPWVKQSKPWTHRRKRAAR
jgi:excisionase family DNA binding protein